MTHPVPGWINRYFGVEALGSTIGREVLAGVSTYLALSYIFVINPAILAQAGMNPSSVLFATVVASAGATLAMGLWARLPFVLAPGMEMNAYVAFFAVGALGLTWQQGLGAVFWSGVLFSVVTFTGLREGIIESIPPRMKSALALSVGTFLVVVALQVAGILRYDGTRLAGLGVVWTPEAAVLVTSLSTVLLLDRLGFKGAVIASIAAGTLVARLVGVQDVGGSPPRGESLLTGVGAMDWRHVLSPSALNVILVLFLVDFYGSVAKFIGLTERTNLQVDGRLPRLRRALAVDGVATMGGAALGTTSITTYVESAVGIGVGGRTGLTAVVCGVLMAASLLLEPVIAHVPVVATTGALILVAIKLSPSPAEAREVERMDLLVMVAMQATVVLTFALDRAMLVGFLLYLLYDLRAGRTVSPVLAGSTLALAMGWALSGLG